MPSINCSFLSRSFVNPIIQAADSPSHFSVVWHALLYLFWQHIYSTSCIFWPNIKWFTFSDRGNERQMVKDGSKQAKDWRLRTPVSGQVYTGKRKLPIWPFPLHTTLFYPVLRLKTIPFPFSLSGLETLAREQGWQFGNNYLVTFFKARALDRNTFLFLLIPDSPFQVPLGK